MDSLRDRFLLLCCGAALLWGQPVDWPDVVVVLTAVTVSAANGYFQSSRLTRVGTLLYAVLCIIWPSFCLFLPLVAYDALCQAATWPRLLCLLPLVAVPFALPAASFVLISVFMVVAYLLGQRTTETERLRRQLARVRDDSHEFSLLLQQKNRDLLEKQGYEVRLATLNERNRIAREIHDQVGHLLSRSILQVGAMLVMPRAATEHKQLVALRDTLTQAMNSIRRSVHDLHEESVDLRMQLLALVDSFLFCPLRLDYRLESEPDQQIKYCFLAIVKEGLHNIARHSNASQASLTLLEHPAFYQLILQDNGSSTAAKSGEGLGLKNMAERVAALGGQFSAGQQDGFRVFVSVPKRR